MVGFLPTLHFGAAGGGSRSRETGLGSPGLGRGGERAEECGGFHKDTTARAQPGGLNAGILVIGMHENVLQNPAPASPEAGASTFRRHRCNVTGEPGCTVNLTARIW